MQHRSRWRPSIVVAGAGVLLAVLLLAGAAYSLWREQQKLTAETAARQALLARVLEDHASRSLDATQIALAGLADIAARCAAGAARPDPGQPGLPARRRAAG
jgi:hypothetical protein